MSKLSKWRSWCERIESEILTPYKFDKLIAEEYFRVVKPVLDSGKPADFHNWCSTNYGVSLALTIRKLSDADPRVYSIRKLVGDIAHNNTSIKRPGYINRYPKHFRGLAKENWKKGVSPDKEVLPKDIPLRHVKDIDAMTKRINGITNKFLAHTSRAKNKRYQIEFDEMYSVIRELIRIGYFYSDLVGGKLADDDSNVTITYEWTEIFNVPWLK